MIDQWLIDDWSMINWWLIDAYLMIDWCKVFWDPSQKVFGDPPPKKKKFFFQDASQKSVFGEPSLIFFYFDHNFKRNFDINLDCNFDHVLIVILP